MKIKHYKIKYFSLALLAFGMLACKNQGLIQNQAGKDLPKSYSQITDSLNSANLSWRQYYTDSNLVVLIDSAIANNKSLNIIFQEITMAKNEVRVKKGDYLPFAGIGLSAGVEKTSRYTRFGALESSLDVVKGRAFPDPLGNLQLSADISWEVDIWHKLRNAKKSAINNYLSSVAGKNFMLTELVAEIANNYYELLALDTQLDILKQNINIQNDALKIVRMQKESARVNELAVKRFEAQLLNTQAIQFQLEQRTSEVENHLNYLLGRFPQTISRSSFAFTAISPSTFNAGIPVQLIQNRPDIQQAEYNLIAANLNVEIARANFYPRLGLLSGVGLQAINPKFLIQAPQSLMYSMLGSLLQPLVNRNAIKANYANANAKQIQAVFAYEQVLLNAFVEVSNQLSQINNLGKSYQLKSEQMDALNQSVTIATELFKSARADYMEVLLTQREALETKFELIETKKQQMNAAVNVYKALGGGWN